MRTYLSLAVSSCVLVFALFPAGASGSHMGRADKAIGKGLTAQEPDPFDPDAEPGVADKFSFAAENYGAVEDDAHGRMELQFHEIEAAVTCLKVTGNRATIMGQITKEPENLDPSSDYESVVFWAEDNGRGTPPDRFSYNFFMTPATDDCPPFTIFTAALYSGDIMVEDR